MMYDHKFMHCVWDEGNKEYQCMVWDRRINSTVKLKGDMISVKNVLAREVTKMVTHHELGRTEMWAETLHDVKNYEEHINPREVSDYYVDMFGEDIVCRVTEKNIVLCEGREW